MVDATELLQQINPWFSDPTSLNSHLGSLQFHFLRSSISLPLTKKHIRQAMTVNHQLKSHIQPSKTDDKLRMDTYENCVPAPSSTLADDPLFRDQLWGPKPLSPTLNCNYTSYFRHVSVGDSPCTTWGPWPWRCASGWALPRFGWRGPGPAPDAWTRSWVGQPSFLVVITTRDNNGYITTKIY